MACMSMTGFGEGRAEGEGVEVVVEVKTVNHRFLDVVCRLPGVYSKYEIEIGKTVKDTLRRGRVEVSVQRSKQDQGNYAFSFNQELFDSYVAVVTESLKKAKVSDAGVLAQSLAQVYSRREVLDVSATEDVEEKERLAQEQALVEQALEQALVGLCEMREAEGAALEKELLSQLALLEVEVKAIEAEAARTPLQFKERLELRLEKIGGSAPAVDPERLAQEVVLLADKIDVTEEISRLGSHFEQFRSVLGTMQSGRKLEFLLQEFGREVNTVGSKSHSSEITTRVVESKAILEKIREQVQNVE